MYAGAIVGVVFWLFIAGVSITPLVIAYKIRRAAMETIKIAIEKGQELSPDTVKQLSTVGDDKPVPPANLMIGGIIVSAIGVGAALVATIFLTTIPVVSPYVYAGAAMALCVGGALALGAKVLDKHQRASAINQHRDGSGSNTNSDVAA